MARWKMKCHAATGKGEPMSKKSAYDRALLAAERAMRRLARPTDEAPEYQVRKTGTKRAIVVLQYANDAEVIARCKNERLALKTAMALNYAEGH